MRLAHVSYFKENNVMCGLGELQIFEVEKNKNEENDVLEHHLETCNVRKVIFETKKLVNFSLLILSEQYLKN